MVSKFQVATALILCSLHEVGSLNFKLLIFFKYTDTNSEIKILLLLSQVTACNHHFPSILIRSTNG
jgi:hypothetical protein